MRFDKRIRSACSVMYLLSSILFFPIVLYVPALAFNQMTGIGIHTVSWIVCLVCIFYTLLVSFKKFFKQPLNSIKILQGGVKAVVWTDLIQIILMYGTLLLIMIKGTFDVGGLSVVWDRNMVGGRIDPPR